MKIAIKRLTKDAILPSYATAESAGADLYATEAATVPAGEKTLVRTGVAVAIPEGYAGFIYARSGLATKSGLAPANKVGVVDADYRGEIMVALHNHSAEARTVSSGDRVAQLVIAPFLKGEFFEAEELCHSERGSGGFGSTGK